MPEPIHIKEQSSIFWKVSAFVLMMSALILFLIYWNDTNALWSGIFRFISFILFAGSVLSILRISGGHRTVSLYEEAGQVVAAYKKEGEIILKESHNPDDIKQIYYRPQTGYQRLAGGGYFFIEYKKSIPDACMFQFAGQCLAFDQESKQALSPFLADFGLNIIG